MVEFIQETEHGSPDGEGEFELVTPVEFTGLSLEERWEAVKTFIQEGRIREEDPGVPGIDIPEVPGEGVDLSELNQSELLQLLIETVRVQTNTNISMLSTMFDIYASVRESRGITIIGAEIIRQQDVPQEVISQDSPDDSVLTRELFIRADDSNTASIAFGDDQVQPQSAFVLNKGEVVRLPVDIGRLDLYMASEEEDQIIQLLGLR